MDSEAIATFILITGVEDESLASQFLEMSGGDLDTAVSLYFEHGLSATSNTNNNNINTNDSTPAADEELANRLQNEAYQSTEDQVRAPIQSTVQRLVDDMPYYDEPISRRTATPEDLFGARGPAGVFNQTFDFRTGSLDSYSRRSAFQQHTDDNDDDVYEVMDTEDNGEEGGEEYSDIELVPETDSEGDITYTRRRVVRRRPRRSTTNRRRAPGRTAHQQRLAELFSPPWDIISAYDLNGGKHVGRETKKWLMVNLQDNTEFRCQQLNRDLWSKTEVKEVVRENFIFLQYPKDSAAGQEYSAYYPFTEFPHILILDPKTGERVKMWSEVPDARAFVEQVVDFLNRFSLDPGHVNPIVQHKTKIDPDSLTEEQQMELAIKKSLGADVDEEEGVVEHGNDTTDPIILDDSDEDESDVDIESDDDVEEIGNGQFEQNVKEASAQVPESAPKEEKLEDLTDEEIFATILPQSHAEPENGPSTTRVQIRSGDGSRVVRRFEKTAPVQELYEFIKNDFKSVEGTKFFTLMSQRTNLIRKIRDTFEEAGLLNASILLEIEE